MFSPEFQLPLQTKIDSIYLGSVVVAYLVQFPFNRAAAREKADPDTIRAISFVACLANARIDLNREPFNVNVGFHIGPGSDSAFSVQVPLPSPRSIAERPGLGKPGQSCSKVNRGVVPALPAAGC